MKYMILKIFSCNSLFDIYRSLYKDELQSSKKFFLTPFTFLIYFATDMIISPFFKKSVIVGNFFIDFFLSVFSSIVKNVPFFLFIILMLYLLLFQLQKKKKKEKHNK